MQIYLVRHGIAVDIGTHDVTRDQDRMLSDEGLRRTRWAALGIKELCGRVPRVISSPLIRAKETAEIMAEVLGSAQTVEVCLELAPAGDLTRLIGQLEFMGPDSVMLVGHMPDLGKLASMLLSGTHHLNIEFKKGACCFISFPGAVRPGQGRLEWLMQPKALRSIAGRS